MGFHIQLVSGNGRKAPPDGSPAVVAPRSPNEPQPSDENRGSNWILYNGCANCKRKV